MARYLTIYYNIEKNIRKFNTIHDKITLIKFGEMQ